MKILLFDMDGVLLAPHAYHEALQETVTRAARALGFPHMAFTAADVAAFEAAGITNEWDSAAICAALLLAARWQADPEAAFPPLSGEALPPLSLPAPNCRAFAAALAPEMRPGETPPAAAWRLLQRQRAYTPRQRQALQTLLLGAREIGVSPTMRLFQELVLGSRTFAEVYRLPPRLHIAGYLESRDVPHLSAPLRERLLAWLAAPDHHAAVMTNRPTRTPDGTAGTPEGEAGMRLVGLESVPLVGWGALAWEAQRRGMDSQTLIKPAPAHALTALLCALGEPLESALGHAAALAVENRPAAVWQRLHGAAVWVFEDTITGIHSLQAAQRLLQAAGVKITVHPVGIATAAAKRRALVAAGAQVYGAFAEALEEVLG